MSFLKSKIFSYIYLPGQKKLIAIIMLTLLASSVLGYLTPIVIKRLFEAYSVEGALEIAIRDVILLVLFEYFIAVVYQVGINKYVQKLLSHIRSKSYQGWMLSLESSGGGQFEDQKYPMGEVLARILTDTEAVIEMVSTGSFRIFIDLTFIASCLVGFINLNTTSGVALIIAEVLACVGLVVGSKKMALVYMEVRKSTGIMSRMIANLAGGFRFSYFHPNESYASKKGEASFEDFLKKQLKANVWDASYFSLAESLFPILLALLVLVFPYTHITEVAIIAAIVDLIQRSISPIKEVAGKISSIQRARTGIIRIEEFNQDLDTLPKTHFDSREENLNLSELEVRVDQFTYASETRQDSFKLENIHFQARRGELIGIVGQSGCGKSTLLKILSTDIMAKDSSIELKHTAGKLEFSGQKLENLMAYKSQVSIVSQDSHVFSASLLFNITLDHIEDNNFENFWNRVCTSIPYVQTWGVTPQGEIRPKELSLGQKQLLSALRSCYLAKPIVLFDEISSGLDSELEEALRLLVLMIQKNSLTIIVAHRIETIIKADKILVMQEGELVDQGKHEVLLKNSAAYQEFFSQVNKF